MTSRSNDGMSRRETLARLGGLGGGLALAGCGAPRRSPTGTGRPRDVTLPDRPNVVVIYVDDLGWLDTGFQGSKYYETPNMDVLAAGGLTFRAGYSNAPNCAPSRASLLTGQYTPRHGVYTVGYPDRVAPKHRKLDPPPNNRVLPTDHATVAEVLSAAGYATGFVGKWHVGEAGSEHGPLARGFDVNVGGGIHGFVPSGYFPPYDLPNVRGKKGQYLPDRLSGKAVEFVRKHAGDGDPFFLLFSSYVVHTPLQAPRSDVERYEGKPCWKGQCNATYGGMVTALDRAVGRVADALTELGIEDETLVILSSDNGGVGDYGEIGIGGNWSGVTSMGPLTAGKGTLYEGGIRVPTVVSMPGVVPSDRVRTPVIGSDVFPTLVDLAGAGDAVPADHPVDGESLVPLIERGESPDRDALFWHFPAYLKADVEGAFRTTPVSVVRSGRWKLHHYYGSGRTELYDLGDDLSERNNRANQRPEKRDELHARLKRWKREVGARNPRPR